MPDAGQLDDLDHVYQQARAMLRLLRARAAEDVQGAVLSAQNYEPRVSGSRAVAVDRDDQGAGSVTLTRTEWAVERLGQAHTYRAVVGKLRSTVKQLGSLCDELGIVPDHVRAERRRQVVARFL